MRYLPLALVLYLAGCSTPADVVTTSISYNPDTRAIDLKSPKNLTISGLQYQSGDVSLTIDEYTSTADGGALQAVQAQHELIHAAITATK